MSKYLPSDSIKKIETLEEAKDRMITALNTLFVHSGSDGDPFVAVRSAIKTLIGDDYGKLKQLAEKADPGWSTLRFDDRMAKQLGYEDQEDMITKQKHDEK